MGQILGRRIGVRGKSQRIEGRQDADSGRAKRERRTGGQ
jgi:hypothetical protein